MTLNNNLKLTCEKIRMGPVQKGVVLMSTAPIFMFQSEIKNAFFLDATVVDALTKIYTSLDRTVIRDVVHASGGTRT
jgi:hypothetical protein